MGKSYQDIIHSDEFKAWFGDWETAYEVARLDFSHPAWKDVSKVVDEQGRPLVMYHGSATGGFSIFKIEKWELEKNWKYKPTYWFANNYKAAEYYTTKRAGNKPMVYKVFLKILNPLFESRDLLKTDKHDGKIEYEGKYNSKTGLYEKSTKINTAVTTSSNQIKLADGVNTTFDPVNPDIRYDEGGQFDDDEIDKIIDKFRKEKYSKITSADLEKLDDEYFIMMVTGGWGHLTKAGISEFAEDWKDEIFARIADLDPNRLTHEEWLVATEKEKTAEEREESESNMRKIIFEKYYKQYNELPTRFIKISQHDGFWFNVEFFPNKETGSSSTSFYSELNGVVEYLKRLADEDKKSLNPKSVESLQRDNEMYIDKSIMKKQKNSGIYMTLPRIEETILRTMRNGYEKDYMRQLLQWLKDGKNPNDEQNTFIVVSGAEKVNEGLTRTIKMLDEKNMQQDEHFADTYAQSVAVDQLLKMYHGWVEKKYSAEYINIDSDPEFKQYLDQALDNLNRSSRTAKGILDASASENKKKIFAVHIGDSAEHIAIKAIKNFTDTMKSLYLARKRYFAGKADAMEFVMNINRGINKGIVDNNILFRTEDSTKFHYTKVAQLDKAFEQFCEEFMQRINSNTHDQVETAAWIHWRVNMTDHYFADGCSKTADALGYFILMRNDISFYKYPQDRSSWYAFAPKTIKSPADINGYYDSSYKAWVEFFKTLFTDKKSKPMDTLVAKKKIAVLAKNGKPGTIRPAFMKGDILSGRQIENIMPNGEKRKAQFVIVELDDIIASHNEETFSSSEGYPVNELGININDRNYTGDISAQKAVQDYAKNLSPERIITTSRTPSGTTIISTDGFVVSGNNRTMSAKLAAKIYPEKYDAYIKYLIEEAPAYGFDAKQIKRISEFEHPYLVRIDFDFPNYDTGELSKYNKDTKKSERPIDKAVKLSNMLKANEGCFTSIANLVEKYETFSEMYANRGDQKRLANIVVSCNLLTEQELPAYYEETGFTEAGKDFIEAILASMILERDALVSSGQSGVRQFRQSIITSLPVLIANANLPEGSLKDAINKAIVIQYQVAQSGLDFGRFISQPQLFGEKFEYKAAVLNRLLALGRNKFKGAIEKYNTSTKDNAGASLFGEKIELDEIFDGYITKQIEEEDLSAILTSPVVEQPEKLYVKGQDKASVDFPLCWVAADVRSYEKFKLFIDKTPFEYEESEDFTACFMVDGRENALMTARDIEKQVVKPHFLSGAWVFESEKDNFEKLDLKQVEEKPKKQVKKPQEKKTVSMREAKKVEKVAPKVQEEKTPEKKHNPKVTENELKYQKIKDKINTWEIMVKFDVSKKADKKRLQKKIDLFKQLLKDIPKLGEGGLFPELEIEQKPQVTKKKDKACDDTLKVLDPCIKKPVIMGEINILYHPDKMTEDKIHSSKDVYDFIIKQYDPKRIELQESVLGVFLNKANQVIGFRELFIGSTDATTMDIKLIASIAIKVLAAGVIMAHNHPSGNAQPSTADMAISKKIKEGLELLGIRSLDFLIVTPEKYYSFADEGIMAEGGTVKPVQYPDLMNAPVTNVVADVEDSEELINVMINDEPRTVRLLDYVMAKTKDLQEFGYGDITQEQVLDSVRKIQRKENPESFNVIDRFIEGDIILGTNK